MLSQLPRMFSTTYLWMLMGTRCAFTNCLKS